MKRGEVLHVVLPQRRRHRGELPHQGDGAVAKVKFARDGKRFAPAQQDVLVAEDVLPAQQELEQGRGLPGPLVAAHQDPRAPDHDAAGVEARPVPHAARRPRA